MPTVADVRRQAVLLALGDLGAPTAQEVVDWMAEHDYGHLLPLNGRYDRVFDSLKALEQKGRVERDTGRPARWTLAGE